MWNKLSMKEKAALIKVAVSNGLTDLDLIKNKYNEFANGGNTESFDEKVSEEDGITTTDVLTTGASFIPFVGTGLDMYDFYKEPSVENALWALASLGMDIYSVGQESKAVRAAKLARQAQKAHDIAKMRHLNSVVRRGNTNYKNNLTQFRKQRALAEAANQQAKQHIKNAVKAETISGLVFNGTQQAYDNQEIILDMVNNPQNYLNEKALGGPLLNQNNPIESFNGGRRLPVVRYGDGGFTDTTVEETPYVGILPEITVNASTNSARSNKAYRNWLQKQEQQELNNSIREGADNFARPIQDIMLSTMAAPVLNPVTSRVGSYIGTKVPTIARNVGKQVFTAGQNLYDVYSTGNSIFNAFKK